jgi:hypothetical protein
MTQRPPPPPAAVPFAQALVEELYALLGDAGCFYSGALVLDCSSRGGAALLHRLAAGPRRRRPLGITHAAFHDGTADARAADRLRDREPVPRIEAEEPLGRGGPPGARPTQWEADVDYRVRCPGDSDGSGERKRVLLYYPFSFTSISPSSSQARRSSHRDGEPRHHQCAYLKLEGAAFTSVEHQLRALQRYVLGRNARHPDAVRRDAREDAFKDNKAFAAACLGRRSHRQQSAPCRQLREEHARAARSRTRALWRHLVAALDLGGGAAARAMYRRMRFYDRHVRAGREVYLPARAVDRVWTALARRGYDGGGGRGDQRQKRRRRSH